MESSLQHREFAKSLAMHACMPTWSTCQRALVPAWFTCQRVCMPASQKRAKFSFLRGNAPINVPTCHTAYQSFNLTCQRAKRHANFSSWRASVPKGIPIFWTFLWRNDKENFYTLILCKKFYITIDIIVIHVISRTYKLYYTSFLYFMS